MSTRSCIILKLRESDINKKKQFAFTKLPVPLKGWDAYHEETAKEFSKQVRLNKPYIGIYCHSDGYPSGVGKVLKEKFTNYDDILNLIVGGDCSFVWFDGVRHYANRPNESWEWIKPTKEDSPIEIVKQIDNEYAYLFENGEWKMKHWDDKDFHEYDENED